MKSIEQAIVHRYHHIREMCDLRNLLKFKSEAFVLLAGKNNNLLVSFPDVLFSRGCFLNLTKHSVNTFFYDVYLLELLREINYAANSAIVCVDWKIRLQILFFPLQMFDPMRRK